ncbi:aarF domain-containing protein kinase 1 [Impatiens glandulifera]|uniref:aarF domain-containing protein kinase 1 n=1 Tax=Impatiens glandulifera TaxID=253017 RepID=UPI001FB06D4A|nr:aarF domain-containing protein kinase 1 [Impatiens glandulifera]
MCLRSSLKILNFRRKVVTVPICLLTLTVAGASLSSKPLNPFSDHSSDNLTTGLDGILRSSRALWTITSNVVDYKYSLYGLPNDSDQYRHLLSEVHSRSAKRILKLCEANKGFYVKAGQFAAALRQLPTEYSSTLASLHDQATPCNFKAIKEVLNSNLGKDLSQIFLSFDEQPVAAASIAQVHHAVLKDHHEEVAVKVQYPGLEQQLKVDIKTMSFISKSVAFLFPEYRFHWLVSEFAEAITLELDFVSEAKNSERTANNFRNSSIVKIPRVFWELTTSRVMTMEFCKGCKVNDVESLKEFGVDPVAVANELANVFSEMIFVHGFVHGDPHPGNILVSPRGKNGFYLVILDHGIYKQLNEEFRLGYCQLWKALILQDPKGIRQMAERFGVGKYYQYFPVMFTGRTINSNSGLGQGMTNEEKVKMREELKSLTMEDVSSFMESLPPDFLTIIKTDGLLRSLMRRLGASQRVSLQAYAKNALYGLMLKHGSYSGKWSVSKFKANLSYLHLRIILETVEWLSWVAKVWNFLTRKFKQVLLTYSPRYLVPSLFLSTS